MDERIANIRNKLKIAILVVLAVATMFIVSSCGNRQVGIDTNQSFSRAWIKLGNNMVEMHIKAWRDFREGDEIQITAEDGTVYLTHYSNVVLMSK